MAKRQKTKAFSIQGFDSQHYKTTDAYTRAVGNLFDRAMNDIAAGVAKLNVTPDKPFQFCDYPSAQATIQRVANKLAKGITAVVADGSRKQWLFACQKNDEFVASIMNTSKLSKARLNKMQDRNLDSLKTFQDRKVDGMNLSQRVWKYTEQFKEQIECGLDVGLGEGRSAQELSRDLRQNLNDPNRLFRRVRDKRGNLQLSKNAQAFHPGRGVYRSSCKNAMRLTRSEINMAYREADWLRWQQLDFVIGFEVHRTNHEPQCKCSLCERLKGKYPKSFKFKGWHPQCMCYVTPILTTDEEFDAQELSDLKSALRGTEYKKLAVKEPEYDGMKSLEEWAKDNQDAQGGWSSTPYFIKDNFIDGSLSKGIKPQPKPKQVVPVEKPVERVNLNDMPEEDVQAWRAKWKDIESWYNANVTECGKYGVNIDALEDYIANALWCSRKESKYWLVDEARAEMERKKVELANAKANHWNNQLKPYNAEIDKIRQDARLWGLNTFPVDDAIAKQDIVAVVRGIKEMQTRIANVVNEYNKYISDATQAISEANKCKVDCSAVQNSLSLVKGDKREWTMAKASILKELSDLKNKMLQGDVGTNEERIDKMKKTGVDIPHPAMKKAYSLEKDVDDTLKIVNSGLNEKWFEHGDCVLSETRKSGVNGFTNMRGKISLKPERVKYVKSAMTKIGNGKSSDITFEEADAMATFWHEIMHNRNKPGNMWTTKTQTDVMEMMNEFVARKSLPEFYEILGCAKTPHPEFINNRSSTGYNRRVLGFDYIIQKFGLDPDVVYQSARKGLFSNAYTNQAETATQALIDGGLSKFKCTNGKKLGKAQINKIIALCRQGYSTDSIEIYLRNNGIIK